MMLACSRLAAQIEEAVPEADFLGIFLLARHRQRQFVGAPTAPSPSRARTSISPVGRFGLTRPRRARHDLAGDRHHAFDAQALEQLEKPGRPLSVTIWVMP